MSCLSYFLSCASRHGRVKQRSFNLHLLVKPYVQISRIRLSSGISHNRRRNYLTDISIDFGLGNYSTSLHDILPGGVFAYSFGRHTFLVFYYPIGVIMLLPLFYPDQNPFAGTGLSFHTVAPCTLRHRFCISSACPSSLL